MRFWAQRRPEERCRPIVQEVQRLCPVRAEQSRGLACAGACRKQPNGEHRGAGRAGRVMLWAEGRTLVQAPSVPPLSPAGQEGGLFTPGSCGPSPALGMKGAGKHDWGLFIGTGALREGGAGGTAPSGDGEPPKTPHANGPLLPHAPGCVTSTGRWRRHLASPATRPTPPRQTDTPSGTQHRGGAQSLALPAQRSSQWPGLGTCGARGPIRQGATFLWAARVWQAVLGWGRAALGAGSIYAHFARG